MRAWLLRHVQAAAAASLLRLAEKLERQAPHPGLRDSLRLPTPEELPAVLARVENERRERERSNGYPEFGRYAKANPAYLRSAP